LNGVSLGQAFLATTKVLEVDALVTSSSWYGLKRRNEN
jgi:hypothetical protein